MFRMSWRLGLVSLLAGALGGCLTPEQRAANDTRIASLLSAERQKGAEGEGIVVADATVTGAVCDESRISVARDEDGRLVPSRTIQGSFAAFGRAPPTPQVLKAGQYVIVQVACRQGRNTRNFRGRHATFSVRSGEVVNIGRLNIEHKNDGFFSTSGTMRKSVQPIPERLLADVREKMPSTMDGMVSRPMTLLGAEESKTQQRFF